MIPTRQSGKTDSEGNFHRGEAKQSVYERVNSPCAQIILYRNDEVVFAFYDYGTFQTLYLNEEEVHELRNLLEKASFPRDILLKQTVEETADNTSPEQVLY